ncbi:MAG: DeoR/GlpR transcriptional regulator [Gammaproteobacteria bacterium]|nr:DeoR/GlpR transcriptional regulator [Gammaproteobacteria bacterium]
MNSKPAERRQHTNHREREILDEIRLTGGSCRIQFLAERLQVTEETIRRNLKSLEAGGHVRKVHGGVHLLDVQNEPSFQQRMSKNPDAKRVIAAKAAEMIHDGDSLFLDIGSTTAYIAMALQNHKKLFVVTNSISVAHTLASRNGNRIFLAGGELRAHDGGAFGLEAANFIRRFSLQYGVFSVAGINGQSGFMLFDVKEAELSREAIARCQTCIIAADSDKFDRSAPVILEEPSAFDCLITDKAPNGQIQQLLKKHSVDLIVGRQ